MSVSINQNYVSRFSSNLYHLVGAQGSKLMSVFEKEVAQGEKHFFDRLGDFGVFERTSANQATILQDAEHSRRMATVRLYEAFVGLDKIDINKMLLDPTSDYIRKLSNKHGQNFDVQLFNALLGSAATGKDGAGSVAFDTSNNQIAHGSAGLTIAKFHQALRILESNRVDVVREDVIMFVNARAIEDLMADSAFTSADYQNIKALSGKELPMFRGVQLIRTEDIPVHTAGSVYRGIMCTRDSLKVALVEDIKIEVDKRPDLSNIYQIGSSMMFGAVRMEEEKVVDILFQ